MDGGRGNCTGGKGVAANKYDMKGEGGAAKEGGSTENSPMNYNDTKVGREKEEDE
jgi:hypothetical protein